MVSDKNISKELGRKRKEGNTSGMWIFTGISKMVRMGRRNDLYDWEKKFFDKYIGIRWEEKGNRIEK